MNKLAVCVVAVAGASLSAHGQLMKMLVSTDGVNFGSTVFASPGQTIQVLVTVSYTGNTGISMYVAGFGSANFQPTVSNWHATDTLLPLSQGSNDHPTDGSGMVMPQFYTGISAGVSTASYGHIHSGYVPGTYGRVLPMGRTFLDGANALQGFVHDNPDGSGLTYLRIAQGVVPMWIGQPGNVSGGSGVNCAQLDTGGRTLDDPDFWGNRDSVYFDDTDPSQGFALSDRIPANDIRRSNVELFRFAFTLDTSPDARQMIVDAPLAGQQGYIRYVTSTGAGLQLAPVVQTGTILVNVPAPAVVSVLGIVGHASVRRRRAVRFST